MRSSDQRYFHVQRTQRSTEDHTAAVVGALRVARNTGDMGELVAAIHASAAEFPAVLLAGGQTANDFRRSFRRGSPAYYVAALNTLAQREWLLEERLDGFAFMRLSREQHRTVRDKAEKVRAGDRLISDPQGTVWADIAQAGLLGVREDHADLIERLRDEGRGLGARTHYEISPYPEADELPGDLPGNEQVLPYAARQFLFYRDKRTRYDQWRNVMTTPVRMLSAYLDGQSMMAARYCRADEPSTHEHRRHFQERIDRIEREIGPQLSGWAEQWNGKRPEELRTDSDN